MVEGAGQPVSLRRSPDGAEPDGWSHIFTNSGGPVNSLQCSAPEATASWIRNFQLSMMQRSSSSTSRPEAPSSIQGATPPSPMFQDVVAARTIVRGSATTGRSNPIPAGRQPDCRTARRVSRHRAPHTPVLMSRIRTYCGDPTSIEGRNPRHAPAGLHPKSPVAWHIRTIGRPST